MRSMFENESAVPVEPLVSLQPYSGESLIGFLSRSIASSAISEWPSVSRLCREEVRIFRLNSEVPGPGISALVGSMPDELSLLLDRHFVYPPDGLAGMQISLFRHRNSLARLNARRVAPAGLRKANFHRRVWDNPYVSFDLETLTDFVETCPSCGETLGWRNAVEAIHCDNCLTDNGMPTCDLRDLPVVASTKDVPPGLQFASDLACPWNEEAISRLKKSTPKEWRNTAPEVMLEMLISVARSYTRRAEDAVDIASITRAGSDLLGGPRALQKSLDKNFSWNKLWLGRDALLAHETAQRRLMLARIEHRRVYPGRVGPALPARRGDIAFQLCRQKASAPEEVRLKTREALPSELWDAQDFERVSDILGVTPADIGLLVRWGLINLSSPSVRSSLPHRRFVSSASVQRLMGVIRLNALPANACTLQWTSFISIKDWKDNHLDVSWAEVIAGLRTGSVPTFELHSAEACWHSTLHVFSANSLRAVVSRQTRELWLRKRENRRCPSDRQLGRSATDAS